MKNALILHGTDGNSQRNWFQWLKTQLEAEGYTVWVPDLPEAHTPSIKRYNEFIFNNKDWEFNEQSILIGHSSGSVAIYGILQNLPSDVKVHSCYLVGTFKDDLGWDNLSELFATPFDYSQIKQKAKKFVFIHSDNDPYCPLDHAEYLSQQLGGELIIKPGQQHFGISAGGPHYKEFPDLLEIIHQHTTDL